MNYLEATWGKDIFKKLMFSNEMLVFFDDVEHFWGSGVVFRKETQFFHIILFSSSFSCIIPGNQLYFFKILNYSARGMIPAD